MDFEQFHQPHDDDAHGGSFEDFHIPEHERKFMIDAAGSAGAQYDDVGAPGFLMEQGPQFSSLVYADEDADA